MGRGGAVTDVQQVPRLTNVLRAFAASGAPPLNVDEQHVRRQQLLEEKRRQRQAAQPSGLGKTGLASQLFGAWEKTPKAAKEEYEKYLQSVAALLGGEVSSTELQEAASLVWDVLSGMPPPEKERGRAQALRLQPHRDALKSAVGHINEAAVQALVAGTQVLRGWREQLHPGGSSSSSSSSSKAAAAEYEFGSELDFKPPGSSQQQQLASLAALAAALSSQAAATSAQPSPADIRRLYEQEAAAGAAASSRAAAAGEASDDDDDAKKPSSSNINLTWLQKWCSKVSGQEGAAALAIAVCRILLTDGSGDAFAAQLYDLLGDAAVEEIGPVVDQRKALTAALKAALGKVREESGEDGQAVPTYGSTVTVTSRSQQLLQKMERKEKRKAGKAGKAGVDVDIDLLASCTFDELLDTERDTSNTIMFSGGVEFAIGGDGGASARRALPPGTTRKTFKGYEEVFVPPRPGLPPPTEDELVKIESLDDWAQLAFQGYKTLNRIQSRIFRAAYHSNENLLVCAPTGAGKTNIAMITVLREIGANIRFGVIQKAEFKIVYVAPMKALAAEVTANFSRRLAPLGLVVRELTGDMQLSKTELAETQMIVTTPEKWDVITRKGGDVAIAALVRLLIIDEVHLLNDDRGAVIETLIARTLRQVEASQSMIRIVGLSATLPNYQDVATFLRVSPTSGLFHFDASFRPVPLEMKFIGVSEKNMVLRNNLMNTICYDKVVEALKAGHQVMVFVHSRKDTGKTARVLADMAAKAGDEALFAGQDHPMYALHFKEVMRSRNGEVKELFPHGLGIHNAGMLRADRSMTERLFSEGLLKVLVCTATLAWGVNLPAHTVVIKGTQVYDPQKGAFVDLGMLDVQQIFGRAGRPQFDASGEGIIITGHDKLPHYLGMLTSQLPIESKFKLSLVDNLNAEIVLGTVTNVKEAQAWLGYTYLNVRLGKSPLAYGLTYDQLITDPGLEDYKKSLIKTAAAQLKASQMAVYDERSGNLYVTELGRVASHYYIKHGSMVTFNQGLKPHMNEEQLLALVAHSDEFESMMVREEELPELERLLREACPHEVKGGVENKHGKINILMQAYVSRARIESFSLVADMMYVSQNAPRICRALFEICLRRKWTTAAEVTLTLCKCLELRLWPDQHPLRQFDSLLNPELLFKLEDRGMDLDRILHTDAREIGAMLRHPAAGGQVKGCAESFPRLELSAQVQPITRAVLRVQLTIKPRFNWRDKAHGQVMRWLILVEDSDNAHLYHSELWLLTKKMAREESQALAFTIPIFDPLPAQYYIRAVSDTWLHAEALLEVSFRHLILPEKMPPHTELLDLEPLPLSALNNSAYEAMYQGRFTHFNPIQTQAFHTLYHTDENVLLGAPTGSGKTVSSELTMLRVFNECPGRKIIYVAPLKALVRERVDDWGKGLCRRLGKKLVELTGDYTPDLRALLSADIIICTPEKWDGISRNWQSRSYVQQVALVVIDEIHLLGADRGPILEVIVSRMRYIAAQMDRPVRFVGLSTALSNAQDLADWLGIGPAGLFNFKPSVRPVPLECHIQGYPGKFYCPRMAAMNKPAYAAIQMHSPLKPVLVFVSSRRQTRLTALDLITYAVADERPHQFLRMDPDELAAALAGVKDANLRHTLQFGIGLHHAGLNDKDRSLAERLFVEQKIQILVATSTLAWGVNTPAHLVVIKGTEYYDAPTRRYVDFPITDVLQMMGRAGRPQYDRHGVAVIMVHEPKKQFYKRFLYEPFPVESSLPDQVADHFNAEVVAGTIASKQDAVDYLTWTFFFRRLLQNPSYYDLPSTDHESLNSFLSNLVEAALAALQDAGCVEVDGDEGGVTATGIGKVASFYYLRHATAAELGQAIRGRRLGPQQVLAALCATSEYDDLPVRHNEDKVNAELANSVAWQVDTRLLDNPHVKANLLLQAHMQRLPMPVSDYITDAKTALDNSLRILQAMVDVAADDANLATALATMALVQCLMQGLHPGASALHMLPGMSDGCVAALEAAGMFALPQLLAAVAAGGEARRLAEGILGSELGGAAKEAVRVVERLPIVTVRPGKPRIVTRREEQQQQQQQQQVVLEVEFLRTRVDSRAAGSGAGRAYAPRFPKIKEEGYWLVVGHPATSELLALRRTSFQDRSSVRLSFPAVTAAGAPVHEVTLYVMCDCYVGLDQQYDVSVTGQRPVGVVAAVAAAKQQQQQQQEEEEEEEAFWEDAEEGVYADGEDDDEAAAERAFEQRTAAAAGGGGSSSAAAGVDDEGFWEADG